MVERVKRTAHGREAIAPRLEVLPLREVVGVVVDVSRPADGDDGERVVIPVASQPGEVAVGQLIGDTEKAAS